MSTRMTPGLICAASGALGIALGALTLAWPRAVSDDVWSYPFSFATGVAIGVILAVVHLMTLAGYVWVRTLPTRRIVTAALCTAACGFVLLAGAEIAGGVIGRQRSESSAASAVDAAFGISSLLVAAGSIALGVVLVRATAGRLIGLSGIVLLAAVTPANFTDSLGLQMSALMVWSACFVALGVVLARRPRTAPAGSGLVSAACG